MEKFNYAHSLKNIPITSNEYYTKRLIAKTEEFIQRIRWKAFFHLNPTEDHAPKPTYGFKSTKTAPQIKELQNFENDLCSLVNNIQFTNFRSQFQRNLSEDVKRINGNKNVLIPADKTRNLYEVSDSKYNKLLLDNITTTYKKSSHSDVDETNTEASVIAEKLKIDDRVECLAEKTAFITLKDHKEDFKNNPKCRLINPAKTQIGKISKSILDSINNEVRGHLKLSQWKSTQQVLNWFKDISHKSRKRFLQFDICEFYPSITEDLLLKALEFASHVESAKPMLTQENINIILHCRKSFLFTAPSNSNRPTPWQKKSGAFDVTMGAYDGAEVCELVGLYLLKLVGDQFPDLELGLYRDDGLAVHRRIPGPRLDRIRKDLISTFKNLGLAITISTNLETVDFLDVTLDLINDRYGPYRKPNDRPLYVHAESNHPPNVLKQIPISINNRLIAIASSEAEFNKAKPTYQDALTASGYKHVLQYNEPEPAQTRPHPARRKRKITWYNPPYSRSVKTNLGQKFIGLVKKHFTPGSALYSVLNKNTLKLSYSCMKNIKSIIQSHNTRLLTQNSTPDNQTGCNCRVKDQCPIQGSCQKSLVYKATLTTSSGKKTYIGSTNNFKNRYSAHKNSFKTEKYKNATALSAYIWENDLGPNPPIRWEVVKLVTPYLPGNKSCELCLAEKVAIGRHSVDPECLNKRTELAQACRHRARYKLARL